ncbi:hypothetical protein F4553_000553 [Allocatelliglobosispora scoriae]|uniref:Uncharacterized protein n=1 Tax=Allocatelliglobosispora scoriae TaxID=643052 RepID=A0A841BFW0_9ACTN|nr:hypothetical protein [Allocatelliglobosispora scoriae]MBB5867174.1 hypothetical protein [Allocatelliglobosispora scoriae]
MRVLSKLAMIALAVVALSVAAPAAAQASPGGNGFPPCCDGR